MSEEIKRARIRRLRQTLTADLERFLKHHETMIKAIKSVLEERKEEGDG